MQDLKRLEPLITSLGVKAVRARAGVTSREKQDRTLVTDVDLMVQRKLVGTLKQLFPHNGIIAEEEGVRKPS